MEYHFSITGVNQAIITYLHSFLIVICSVFLNSCHENDFFSSENKKNLTILYTNDEHGWMERSNPMYGGATNMKGRWNVEEDSDEFLILSGGDMWSGPDISSYFRGESMVEVMNSMGYSAAALGNHEFDFKVDNLIKNQAKMNFPLLAANIVERKSGSIPDFVEPYTIKKVGGIDVGIIGLSSLSTPKTGIPAHVKYFEFTGYEEAIEKYTPILHDKGVDILIIIGHLCENEMLELLPIAKKHNISLIGGGHCHQAVNKIIDGIALVQSTPYLTSYGRVIIEYLPYSRKAKVLSNHSIINDKEFIDFSISRLVSFWMDEVSAKWDYKIGYCNKIIGMASFEMRNLISDSWLFTFPFADVTIFNPMDIQKDLLKGYITYESINKVLPNDNMIYKLELTGSELIDCSNDYSIGGLSDLDEYRLNNGTLIHRDSTYIVLTTNNLYSSSDYMNSYDPNPQFTSVHFRHPLIDWIKHMNTNSKNPLNNYLKYNTRK